MFPEVRKSMKWLAPLVRGGFDAVDCRSRNQTQRVNVLLTLLGLSFRAHIGGVDLDHAGSGPLRHAAAFSGMGNDVPSDGLARFIQNGCGVLFFLVARQVLI
jgi:hypothetical protein